MQNPCSAVSFRASFSVCASVLFNVSTLLVTVLFCEMWCPKGRWGSLLHCSSFATFWSRMQSHHFTHQEMKNNFSSWNCKGDGRGQNAVTWAASQPWTGPAPAQKCSGVSGADEGPTPAQAVPWLWSEGRLAWGHIPPKCLVSAGKMHFPVGVWWQLTAGL